MNVNISNEFNFSVVHGAMNRISLKYYKNLIIVSVLRVTDITRLAE